MPSYAVSSSFLWLLLIAMFLTPRFWSVIGVQPLAPPLPCYEGHIWRKPGFCTAPSVELLVGAIFFDL